MSSEAWLTPSHDEGDDVEAAPSESERTGLHIYARRLQELNLLDIE